MNLERWISWAFQPNPEGRHPFHSWALCRQASRDLGTPVNHADFIAAMQMAGYRVVCRYGTAMYFNCGDTKEKRQYYRRRYIGADDSLIHPLAIMDRDIRKCFLMDDSHVATNTKAERIEQP